MGYDLTGGFTINYEAWHNCLKLARAFGWRPKGTEAPDHLFYGPAGKVDRIAVAPELWDGNYVTNDFQWVRAIDAYALSIALGRAIDALDRCSTYLTHEQADALGCIRDTDGPWLESVARYFRERAWKGGFSIG
jgi:hypothetical protein